ncbi:MAG: hypothetical protein ACYDCC_13825 [Actinomycetota bacterium]
MRSRRKMQGEPHAEEQPRRRRRFGVISRSNESDHISWGRLGFYYRVPTLISGHHDAPLSKKGLKLWHLILTAVIVGGIVLIYLSARS